MSLPPLSRSGIQLAGAGIAAATMGAVGFLPLFGGPGYEAALAAGMLLPALAAGTTALEVVRSRPIPFAAFGQGTLAGALLAAVGLVTVWLHGLRVGICDGTEGTAFFILGPGLGSVLGGAWGAIAGLAAEVASPRRRRALALALALLGPLGGIAISVARFYTSPMVFAFDPFFGFFAGTLYDTVITGLERLATYRVGSSLTLLAAAMLLLHLYRDAAGRVRLRSLRRPGLVALGLGAAAGSIAVTLAGPSLGHYQTTESLREALGRSAVSERCEVFFPSRVLKRDAHALARDCDAHVVQLEELFETKAQERIVVYLFADAAEKGRLMGAASTYIAKPWRGEIYIQDAGYPHRVLRHELAHVVAASFGRGPFRVAGPLGGWIPDPGRIEGVAVAAAPSEDADLTLAQWAKAMKDLDLLPPLERVFRLAFLGEPSSRAYTVAGAFVQWLRDAHGVEALKRWYGGAKLQHAVRGKSLADLERDWHESLGSVKVGEEAMEVARARFDRPAIFGRRCPHVVDRLKREADRALGRLDTDRARRLYREVLDRDGHHLGARLGLATCALREGDEAAASKAYSALAGDEDLPRAARVRAMESLADMTYVRGDLEAARKAYEEVAVLVVDAGHLRALDIKRMPLDELARQAVAAHLIGDLRYGRDATVAAARLSAWAGHDRGSGLPEYLLGRSLFSSGRWEDAAEYFDRALVKRLTPRRIELEALRSRLKLACVLGQKARARDVYKRWSTTRGESAARREAMEAFAARCGIGARKSGKKGKAADR